MVPTGPEFRLTTGDEALSVFEGGMFRRWGLPSGELLHARKAPKGERVFELDVDRWSEARRPPPRTPAS